MTRPTDDAGALEDAEHACAAAARAVSHRGDLRYRGHLLYAGGHLAPVRAPHVHPDPERMTLTDLRGSADAIALRLRYSDPVLHEDSLPEDALGILIMEFLEQFRVEALAPASASGLQENVRAGFRRWSDDVIASGLLENDLGLLLFTVVWVCWSRVLAESIPDRVSDATEATRFGIYQVLGTSLRDLRPSIRDQGEFARHARSIADSITELAEQSEPTSGRGGISNALVALLDLTSAVDLDVSTAQVGTGRRSNALSDYAIFTTEHDRVEAIGSVVRTAALDECRAELDERIRGLAPLSAIASRTASRLFPTPHALTWQDQREEGYLDPRLIARRIAMPSDDRVYMEPDLLPEPDGAVTFLIDCSGSMKSQITAVACLVDILVRCLDRVDVTTEVLGYTTGSWNGGAARRDWLTAGRPTHPGRLNEQLHLVIKDARTPWRRARRDIGGLLWTSLFREGIDGEAVQWAVHRLMAVPAARHHLVVISDGSPMDGATALANGERYLDHHLAAVCRDAEAIPSLRLHGLGIGHDLSVFIPSSRYVEPDHVTDPDVVRWLLAEFARSAFARPADPPPYSRN